MKDSGEACKDLSRNYVPQKRVKRVRIWWKRRREEGAGRNSGKRWNK